MKSLLLLLFLSASTIGFSQLRDQLKDTLEAKRFWANNIHNIIEGNKNKILDQTNFPLIIQDERVEKEQFEAELEKHFTAKIRSELKAASFTRLKAWYIGDDVTPTYMVPCLELSDQELYLAVVFIFFQYKGEWKLKEIVYQ